MAKKNIVEALIGAGVLAVAGGFLVYASGAAEIGGARGAYPVTAKFFKAEGVGVGSDVRLSGVKVGSVRAMSLDPDSYQAVLRLAIDGEVKLPTDSSAKIAFDGLLGGAFISLDPGAAEQMLEADGEIFMTQSSINVVEMFGKFISSVGGE